MSAIIREKPQTAVPYDRLATVLLQIVQEQAVTTAGNETQTNQVQVQKVQKLMAICRLLKILQQATFKQFGSRQFIQYISGNSSRIRNVLNIETDKNDAIRATIQYITDTYSGFKYDYAKCTRDLKFIAKLPGYDWMLSTNASILWHIAI